MSLLKVSDSGSVQDNVFVLREDRATVSRSKLEHLKELTEDTRMHEPFWDADKTFSAIGLGILFTCIGTLPSYDDMVPFWKALIVLGIIASILFIFYCGVRQYRDYIDREDYRKRLTTKISDIITQMNTMAKINESQRSTTEE